MAKLTQMTNLECFGGLRGCMLLIAHLALQLPHLRL
jgi:hypothetical protein